MTNSQGKTESPKGVEADLWSKPDETSTNEKIKELCPIVITTIDCRPTKFKDADGNILKVTSHSHSKDGPVHTVKLMRLVVKDGVETEVLEGPERTINQEKKHTATEGPDLFLEDGKRVEAMDFEFDRTIQGNPEDDDAQFLVDVKVKKKKGLSVFEGRGIVGGGIAEEINKAAKKFGGATHCMLYVHGCVEIKFTVHGYMCQPQEQIQAAMEINSKWKAKGADAFCVPVVWPAEKPFVARTKNVLGDWFGYSTQKADALGAAEGLKNSILPFLKHKCKHGGGTAVKISIMCHSMGNYVLKKMAPEDGDLFYDNNQKKLIPQETAPFKFDNIFMVAADVCAWTFDEVKGEEAIGKEVTEHEGKAILRLAKHKVHVCWYRGDQALLVRRGTNRGRPALGKNGLDNKYTDNLIEDPKLINKISADKLTDEGKVIGPWNETVTGAFGIYKALGHMYQAEDKALEYYLDQMKANYDKP